MLYWERARDWFERALFAPRRSSSPRERARRLAQYPYALLRDLLGGQLNIHAMGLVYATLLALVPLVAFSFAVLKGFGAHRELEPLIYEFFRPMGDAASELTQKVMDFADHVRGGIVGSVGLAFLIWTLIGTLKKVEDSVNFVWHVEQPRSFVRRIAEYVALLVVAPILIGTLLGTAHITSASSSVRALSQLPLLGQLGELLLALAPLALVSAIFTLVYALIPNTRVRLVPALVGGITAGILWAAIGRVFTAFVLLSTRLAIVYAGFAIFIAALIWIYFGWLILLVGAQLSFYVQNPSYLRIGLREPRLSNSETEQLALSIMYLVARSHLRGGMRWSINALAAELALPGVAVTRSADALEAAGLLVSTGEETLLPGRDAGYIPLQEILAVARASGSVHGDGRHAAPPAVSQLYGEFEGAWRERLGARSLEAWVIGTS
ncbi:MAG: YihY/virulence factor BrkB family protein [Gammaproteobacteria bacterium]|nr:YihY/virulence factor BrkB family protein [Gammaproteobacteria bacterium]